MADRFPGINWNCDRCGALLNNQSRFTDHKYIWKCTNCGYKNSISRANISNRRDFKFFIKRFFELIIAYIEEVAYIGFIGALVLAVLLILGKCDVSSVLSLATVHESIRGYSYLYMGISLIAYPLLLLISYICQKYLYFYEGAYIHDSFLRILGANITVDFKFFLDFFGQSWNRGGRKFLPYALNKLFVFIVFWLIPIAVVALGIVSVFINVGWF